MALDCDWCDRRIDQNGGARGFSLECAPFAALDIGRHRRSKRLLGPTFATNVHLHEEPCRKLLIEAIW